MTIQNSTSCYQVNMKERVVIEDALKPLLYNSFYNMELNPQSEVDDHIGLNAPCFRISYLYNSRRALAHISC